LCELVQLLEEADRHTDRICCCLERLGLPVKVQNASRSFAPENQNKVSH
jgi:hypothetical protein